MYSQVLKTSSLDIVLNIICCVPHKKESHPFNIITLSLSVQLQLQEPLGFRSTSRLQPIILCPWPVRSLSAKPLCRDFLPGSLIVTQIHPVVFFFFTAFTFQWRPLGSCVWLAEVKIQAFDEWQQCQKRLWNKGPDGLWESDWDFLGVWVWNVSASINLSTSTTFFFFLSHCTSACTIYVLFIILIDDSVCSFFIFIMISTQILFSTTRTHSPLFLCTFFLYSFCCLWAACFLLSVVFNLSRFS